jgi:ATP-dependent DNA helicase RecG
MRPDPQITIPELAELIGIPTRSIESNIESLKKSKQLKRIGSAKDGYWEVIID